MNSLTKPRPRKAVYMLSAFMLFAAPVIATLLSPKHAQASTSSFSATADAWVNSATGFTATNYGTDTHLYNNNTAGAIRKSFLKFDVAGIPTGYVVSSATLRLYANAASGSVVNLKPVTDTTWGEGTINYANAPTYGNTIVNGTASAVGYVDFPMGSTTITGNGTYSFVTTTADNTLTDWNSREAASNQPSLVVNFVPANPSSVTVDASADAYVAQAAPTTNYGTNTHLYSTNATSAIRKTFLKFNVAGIPSGTVISGFTLKTYANNASGSMINVKQGTDNSWTESAITYSNAPAYGATSLVTKTAGAVGYVSFPVSGNTAVTGNGTYTFVLTTSDTANTTDWASIDSGANVPQLTVDFTTPSTMTINPTDDAYVSQASPTTNYGTATSLQNNNTSGAVKRSWYKFTVPGLPLHARVTAAQLKLQATNSPTGVTASVYSSTNTSWTEGTLNWNNAPTYGATAIASGAPAPVVAGVETFDVASAVPSAGAYSFVITQAQTVTTTWASKETATPPQLVVTWTTEQNYGHDMVIGAAGDIACDPLHADYNGGNGTTANCGQKATAGAINTFSPDRVFTLGDNQYECGGYGAYQTAYGDAAAWGQFRSITSPITGNHERNASGGTDCDASSNATGFRKYFATAYTPPSPDADGATWWSEDLPNNWHVIALDSDCSRSPNPCASGSTQETWMRADLTAAAAAGRKIFAVWHHPTFSEGDHGDSTNEVKSVLWHNLWTYGGGHVQFALHGHEHNAQEYGPLNEDGTANTSGTGIREIIVGAGGRSHYSASLVSAADASLVQKDTTHFQVLKLALHASSYDVNFVPVSGSFTWMTNHTYSTH